MASEAYDDVDEFDELPADELPAVTDEQRAMAQGWKPRHLYRGPAEHWTDAATFLARGETELPILRDQNRRMSERLARVDTEMEGLRNTIAEQKQAVQDAIALARRADDRGYQRALNELKAEQREAVEAGDTVAFDQVQQQIDALQETREAIAETPTPTPPATPPAPAPAAPQVNPVIVRFAQDNAGWFNDASRPELQQIMVAMHTQVIREGQIPALGDQLEEAKQRLAERFPEHADILGGEPDPEPAPARRTPPPARPRAAPVAQPRGGAPQLPRGRAGDVWAQIPAGERAGAQAAFARMKRQDEGLTADEYVALYVDPHADVLALRRTHRSK